MNESHRSVFPAFLSVLGVLAVQLQTPDPKDIQAKTLAAYSNAKTYQGNWSYLLERGATKRRMVMEIKSKAPAKLYMQLKPAPGEKTPPGGEAIPEMVVVIDGKTAFFENVTGKEY